MDKKKTIAILKGILSYFPFVNYFVRQKKISTRHSSYNARFCYSYWLRLFVILQNHKLFNSKEVIAEIGTAGSFGIGLCALLTDYSKYYALDIENHFNLDLNLKLLDEIVELFRNHEPIPDEKEFPQLNLKLESYDYPELQLRPYLNLSIDRVNYIRNCLIDVQKTYINTAILFLVPWQNRTKFINIKPNIIISRAVMEHVLDPFLVYKKLTDLLKDYGIMFHDIEYHSHDLSDYWNGHYLIRNSFWKIIRGRRSYLLNRLTHSQHEEILSNLKNEIILSKRIFKQSIIENSTFNSKENNNSDPDFSTYGGIILTRKNERTFCDLQ